MCYRGTVMHGVIVLDDEITLPEGLKVDVSASTTNGSVSSYPTEKQSLSDFLMSFAGTIDGLPEDMARNHDHYLHGTPKK